MSEYNPQDIEAKWQEKWEEEGVFAARDLEDGEHKYILVEFPYPSGDGLHVGHCRSYTALDILVRQGRMKGENILFPMGWDAFGLPTENYAIKMGIHPVEATKKNTDTFRRQLKSMGFSFDWSREVNTTDPNYYKWTQWIFLQLYKNGLAYKKEIPINWCPSCKIGLANEEVVEGKCERCGATVEQKDMEQWMLKITDYADKLLAGLDEVDFPDRVKDQQRNWIGRSEGINFKEKVKDLDIELEVYDSIPQTFLAQTFTVIAPDHPMVEELIKGTEREKEVREFVEQVKRRKASGKFDIEKDMEGVFTGRYVDNPFSTGDLPIWVASFVLSDYGTGVVNASAHDERDFAFAKKYGIPLKVALLPVDEERAEKVKNLEEFYREPDGILQVPEELKGMTWHEAREPVINYIREKGWGDTAVNYKLRDWVFSRQHYWGEPIPIIHCDKCGEVAVPEEELPVELPEVEKYEPTDTGESPLANVEEWVNVECPKCGGPGQRETDTMPNWAGSSWYYLRYVDPRNDKELAGHELMKYWTPVDIYNGGMEHTTLHLLYSRFWHKFLFDQGLVPSSEPYVRRTSHGFVLGEGRIKMSKSRGNVVNPDEVVEEYGADTLRIYEMFMGPFENVVEWSTSSVIGVRRFLDRAWGIQFKVESEKLEVTDELNVMLQKTIKRVTDGIEQFKFNTAVAAMMELLNAMEKEENISRGVLKTYVQLLAPFAPHIAEEMWEQLGGEGLVAQTPWPEYDAQLLAKAQVTVPVQVNGKVRGEVTVNPDAEQAEVEELVKEIENVQRYLEGAEVKQVVYVPGRMVNFVVVER